MLFFLVFSLMLFTFLILLLSLSFSVILRTGLIIGQLDLPVPPKRCIFFFHKIHHDSASEAEQIVADSRYSSERRSIAFSQ